MPCLQALEHQLFPAGVPDSCQLYTTLPAHLPRLEPVPAKQAVIMRAARLISCIVSSTAELLALV